MEQKGLDFMTVNLAKLQTLIAGRGKIVFDIKNKHQQHQNLRT